MQIIGLRGRLRSYMNNKWKKWMLDYFDWNNDGKTNWWEYLLPALVILIIEVLADLIANWIL